MATLAFAAPGVGSVAPELPIAMAVRGQPRVLAFARDWSIEREPPEHLLALRAQLRGLGAELIVVTIAGAWVFRPDDAVESFGLCSESELAAATARYGVDGEDAVFVIDARDVVRFAHRPPRLAGATLIDALATAWNALHERDRQNAKQRVLFTRREWSVTCLVVGCAMAFLGGCKEQGRAKQEPAPQPPDEPGASTVVVSLNVNGKERRLELDPRTSLLDALRERLGLFGTKKGCDMGQCGACTVLADGKRITSCLTLAVMAQGRALTTIEGLAKGGQLHPMQQAFIDHDGLQCGYCTPGQILSAVALLDEGHAKTDAEVREQMSGNICRCGAYPNIVAAIQAARKPRG